MQVHHSLTLAGIVFVMSCDICPLTFTLLLAGTCTGG
jgi:hypothetical protein